MALNRLFTKRNLSFLLCCCVALFMFYGSLRDLTQFSFRSQFYSHIWLIPLVSVYFFFTERKTIFSDFEYLYRIGLPIIGIGIVLYFIGKNLEGQLNQNDYSSLMTFAALVFLNGSFLLCYGKHAFKAAMFPLLFLVFMVPIPTFIMDKIIYVLLVGSASATELLFEITGTAFIREGYTFHLPGISIEIANVCSGIRSSLALFITMVIAGHLFLKTNWKKVVLLLVVFPITMFKNGIRIVTISLLAIHVDEKFLTDSFLHHSGGFLFFIPALALLGLVLWWMRKGERT
jgi:exosortase